MQFKTQFDPHDRVFRNPGNSIVETFTGRYDKNGDLKLVSTGRKNLYDEIQSFAAETDMDNILRRFAAGDISVLSQSQGIYGDFENVPMHFTDALNLINDVREQFDALSAEEREKYDNNFAKYGASLYEPKPVVTETQPVVDTQPVVKEEVIA